MRVVRVALWSAAFLSIVSHASAGDPAAARDQLKSGWELAQQGKCTEAIPHLSESLRLDVKAITLINLANCEEKVGHLTAALGHWVDARTRAQSEGNTAIELEAEKRAKELEPRLSHLTITLAKNAPAGAEVWRDGTVLGAISLGVVTTVNPGPHTIVVKAPGRKENKIDLTLAEAEGKKLDVGAGEADGSGAVSTATPAADHGASSSPAGGTSPLVWVGFGVGAAGLAVGAVTGLMAMSKGSAARSDCPNLACPSQTNLDGVQSGRTLGTVSTIGFVVGGVFTAVGVYGLVTSKKKSDGVAASIVVGPTGGGVRGSF